MPELPEVQTIVNQLKENLTGKTIARVDVRLEKLFPGETKDIIGRKIINVSRRAKMVILDLEGPLSLVIHLKMTGQLIYGENKSNKDSKGSNKDGEFVYFPNPIPFAGLTLPGKTTHVVFTFNDGSKLFFNDMRQFGWVKVMNDEELKAVDEKHGPEPFDSLALAQGKPIVNKEFTPEYLEKICANWGRPIKILLLEQSKIAGVGNIYANEALWCAKISPMKRGREVERQKVRELFDGIKTVLEMGLKYGGSSAADEAFVNAKGEPGKMQEHLNVYQKTGKPCPRNDGGKIVMAKIGGRGTFFCPVCQK